MSQDELFSGEPYIELFGFSSEQLITRTARIVIAPASETVSARSSIHGIHEPRLGNQPLKGGGGSPIQKGVVIISDAVSRCAEAGSSQLRGGTMGETKLENVETVGLARGPIRSVDSFA